MDQTGHIYQQVSQTFFVRNVAPPEYQMPSIEIGTRSNDQDYFITLRGLPSLLLFYKVFQLANGEADVIWGDNGDRIEVAVWKNRLYITWHIKDRQYPLVVSVVLSDEQEGEAEAYVTGLLNDLSDQIDIITTPRRYTPMTDLES